VKHGITVQRLDGRAADAQGVILPEYQWASASGPAERNFRSSSNEVELTGTDARAVNSNGTRVIEGLRVLTMNAGKALSLWP
jgi:hypothetical protein